MTGLALFQHIIVWLPLVVGGIFLIRAGLRGRRVNDHPICRRCRFDLVGLGGGERPDRCPECGTTLTGTTRAARRAIIDGEWKRRWWAFSFGVVLVLAGLGTGFWLTYKPLAKFPWTTWAPDWVLAEMVDSPNTARSDMVAREMLQRLQRDELSTSAVRRATTKILVLQADLNAPWRPILGALVESSRAKAVLSDEQWRVYAANAVVIAVEVPPVIGEGARVYCTTRITYRVGGWVGGQSPKRPAFGAEIIGQRQTLGSNSRPNQFYYGLKIGLNSSSKTTSERGLDLRSPPPGTHEGAIEFEVGVFNIDDIDQNRVPTRFVSQRTIAVPFTLNVIDPSKYSVSHRSSPDLRDPMRKSFTIEAAALSRRLLDSHMNVAVIVYKPPMDYAFALMIRTADRDVRLGEMAGRAGEEDFHVIWVDRPPATFSIGDVTTIVLMPDIAAARSKPDIREIWGEEIILENVPITVEDE